VGQPSSRLESRRGQIRVAAPDVRRRRRSAIIRRRSERRGRDQPERPAQHGRRRGVSRCRVVATSGLGRGSFRSLPSRQQQQQQQQSPTPPSPSATAAARRFGHHVPDKEEPRTKGRVPPAARAGDATDAVVASGQRVLLEAAKTFAARLAAPAGNAVVFLHGAGGTVAGAAARRRHRRRHRRRRVQTEKQTVRQHAGENPRRRDREVRGDGGNRRPPSREADRRGRQHAGGVDARETVRERQRGRQDGFLQERTGSAVVQAQRAQRGREENGVRTEVALRQETVVRRRRTTSRV